MLKFTIKIGVAFVFILSNVAGLLADAGDLSGHLPKTKHEKPSNTIDLRLGSTEEAGSYKKEIVDITNANCVNEEVNGLLLFEAENTTLRGAWKMGTSPEASGERYIYFDGANHYGNVNDAHTISYDIKINTPGSYTFKWTMRQPDGEIGSDLGNDVWFYFAGNIASGGGKPLTSFKKFVGRSTEQFTWNGKADLHTTKPWVKVSFASAGVYTLKISGRSHGLQADRFALYKIGTYNDHQAQDKARQIAVTGTCDGGGDGGDATYVTMRKGGTSFAVDGGNGGANHRNVYLWNFNASTPNQQWEEVSKGNGYFAYKKRDTNFCLDGGRDGQNGQNVILYNCGPNNPNQQWKKVNLGEGKYRLEKKNAPGFSISGGEGGANRQNLTLAPSSNKDVNQQWLFGSTNSARFNTEAVLQANPQPKLYPNPLSGGELMIDTRDYKSSTKVDIFDAHGKLVYTTQNKPGLLNISTNMLSGKGLYLVKISAPGYATEIKKIVMK